MENMAIPAVMWNLEKKLDALIREVGEEVGLEAQIRNFQVVEIIKMKILMAMTILLVLNIY